MTPFVSRKVRLAVLERMQASFNDALGAACNEIGTDATYQINFNAEVEDRNLYQGDRTLESLDMTDEPDLPALTIWTGEGQAYGPGQREMPSAWSGVVAVYWRFFLFAKGIRSGVLTDLREATEAALVSILSEEFTDIGYAGDLGWQALNEQQLYDPDEKHIGWVQEVTYQAHFEVTI